MSILSFLQWAENTGLSVGLRESTYSYPVVESIHTLGVCVFMGLILFWDFRLMGVVLRRVPVSEVWSRLIPWITFGAAMMVTTGLLVFWAKPVFFWSNFFFRVKLVGLVLALANAMAFHFGIEKKIVNWDTSPSPPRAAWMAGFFSAILWVVILSAGRLIAYNWIAPL